MGCAYHGHVEVMEMLIKENANLNLKSNEG